VNAILAPAFKLLSAALSAKTDDVALVIAIILNYLFTCERNVLITKFFELCFRCEYGFKDLGTCYVFQTLLLALHKKAPNPLRQSERFLDE